MEQLELAPEASAAPRAEASEASGGGGAALVPVSNLYAAQHDRVEKALQAAGVSLPCERPILVVDRDSGETVKVRCGTRRAAECVSCAALYSGDASAILRAGALDAEPGTVIVMLTLTAPSFGAVHRVPREASPRLSADARAAWQARAGRTKCRCGQVHAVGDRLAGVALDVDSYDYEGQAAWNAGFGRLWNRTATRLARDLGLSARLAYAGNNGVAGAWSGPWTPPASTSRVHWAGAVHRQRWATARSGNRDECQGRIHAGRRSRDALGHSSTGRGGRCARDG